MNLGRPSSPGKARLDWSTKVKDGRGSHPPEPGGQKILLPRRESAAEKSNQSPPRSGAHAHAPAAAAAAGVWWVGMPCCPPPLLGLGSRLRSFLRDYDALQSLALALIYLQIGCALIGSLGALFNGVLVINLVIGLFAVVAIESSSQRLGRTYAVLLFFAVVLDVAWFILFSHAIWTITPDEKYGQLFVFSLRLALWMQIIGFSIRTMSSFIWIQMYRLGASSSTPTYLEANHEARNSFLSPRSDSVRRNSMADDILGGSIYDPSYYSSLFEDVRNNACNHQGDKQTGSNDSGSSAGQSPRLKSFSCRSLLANDVESGLRKPLNS